MRRTTTPCKRPPKLANDYTASLQQLSPEKLEAKKQEIRHLRDVCKYLIRCNIIPADVEQVALLEQLIKDHHWDEKKKN